MVARIGAVVIILIVVLIAWWGWKLLLKPRKLDKRLRDEGYKGNSYKPLIGDMIEFARMTKEAKSKSIPVTHDITPYILPFDHHLIKKYGKMSFMWFGPIPWVYIMDPELIKEIFSRPFDFTKPNPDPIRDSIVAGLVVAEGQKWTEHRQIMNPAFHLENIKSMFSEISSSCSNMIKKWEALTRETGPLEVDVWPYIEHLTEDVISRTAFGSCYEEGEAIFQIQKEQQKLVIQRLPTIFLPGGRFIPIRANRKFKENEKKLLVMLQGMIDKRKKAIEMGEGRCDDLLGILLEANSKKIEKDKVGMSMRDVIDQCKLFYIAGSETTANLIGWTMVCLSLHQEWQMKAREEIMQVFGTEEVHFEGLKHLKILTMILTEVLRLYPPVAMVTRATTKDTKLGNVMMPSGVQIIIPIMHMHHDRDIWGKDAREFKPERFSEGVANATKGKGSSTCFLPFIGGPRVCIGQNFAMTEAKTAMATILQRFSFQLSPSYKHAPSPLFTLPPGLGVHLILRKI